MLQRLIRLLRYRPSGRIVQCTIQIRIPQLQIEQQLFEIQIRPLIGLRNPGKNKEKENMYIKESRVCKATLFINLKLRKYKSKTVLTEVFLLVKYLIFVYKQNCFKPQKLFNCRLTYKFIWQNETILLKSFSMTYHVWLKWIKVIHHIFDFWPEFDFS